ncbi:type I methionyl aminopeptidase [Dietzia sp. ANT_WB102]|uniref:type I methionyl aminopeptidase n=1 Tax=Dietzia sp. ANT_WB102 TaxID=2597345 RepID=UPI0011EEF66E|nr:type I methionyl aminopeptidase [Dietzia sp. ANT_WB102]KAA0919119.1 type I methionyl aminopeptidase [Dietzia sp. ANT_WB102]
MFGRSRKSVVTARTPGELDAMEAAGRIVGRALVAAREAAVPGASTADLDEIVEQLIRDAGAIPSFKGYEGFPGSICSSVNEVVVHGIPGGDTVLREGDLVSVDCGAILDGWHGDSAWSFGVGTLAPDVAALNDATREVLEEGLLAMAPGNKLTDVSHALEAATRRAAERHGISLGIVDGFGGHGIGREMHEWPFLANEGKPGRGPRLQEGSVLAIEPMLVLGGETDTRTLADDWTVVTVDGSPASHWEHTVAVTADGPRILTPRPGD